MTPCRPSLIEAASVSQRLACRLVRMGYDSPACHIFVKLSPYFFRGLVLHTNVHVSSRNVCCVLVFGIFEF